MSPEMSPVAPTPTAEVAPVEAGGEEIIDAPVEAPEVPQVDAPAPTEGTPAEQIVADVAEAGQLDTVEAASERAQNLIALKTNAIQSLETAAAQGDWPQDRLDAARAHIEAAYQ